MNSLCLILDGKTSCFLSVGGNADFPWDLWPHVYTESAPWVYDADVMQNASKHSQCTRKRSSAATYMYYADYDTIQYIVHPINYVHGFVVLCLLWLLGHGLSDAPAWINNCIHYKVLDEIIYPFPNFNSVAVEV